MEPDRGGKGEEKWDKSPEFKWILVGCPCMHTRCGFFWVDYSRCWAASKSLAVSFLNSSLPLQLFLTIQEKQFYTFKTARNPGAYSQLTSVLSIAKIGRPSQDRSLWLWSKKGIGEKELTLPQVLPENTLLCLLWSCMEPQTCTWRADLSLPFLISDVIFLFCHLFSREIACSALSGGVSFEASSTRWHLSRLYLMGDI